MNTKIIIMVIVVIGIFAVSFLSTALLVKLICWAFGKAFSWKLSVGVWAIAWIGRSIFSANSK